MNWPSKSLKKMLNRNRNKKNYKKSMKYRKSVLCTLKLKNSHINLILKNLFN